ncbi:C4-dicarboxylate TRAP transporter substrate-binding protein [Maritimibacter alkaliphilus]|uniref:C4-dicarboxylate TRAP transporter substrate-binding protein n=1 Tax=Maritimibacter alkaliphilus TaxID=404236 RepID=UPI001C985C1C|nr:C4-dicarboxylate TRAP transporter substrate-binding protein [Maritimibacter alkaliphilus]MBY6089624.1 C4-dicarboxylate TRAP transporter substrate-binding protein [Maritimibacter alkaliphilus]
MKTTSFVALAIAGIMATGAAQARELRLAPAAPPAHPAHYMYEHFAENLKEISGGAITGTIMGPEVVSLPQMKDALQTGLAEVGNTLPLYFPADMEVTGIAGDLALAGRNPHAMAMAMTEFGMTCEPCQAEFKKLGMVFLGAGSSNVYNLITTKPVRTAEDLKGLRLRTGGAPYSRWAENFGATPVNMGVGDQFEAISQGTIDGTMASKVDLLSYRLIDIAKYVTLIPIGTYHVTSNFTVGLSTWQGMSPEEREQVGMAAARANFDLTDRWAFQLPAKADEALAGSSIEVIEPDPAFLEASEAFAREDVASRTEMSGEQAVYFGELVEKWTAIAEDVGDDPDALAARIKEELWSKIDFATYGL